MITQGDLWDSEGRAMKGEEGAGDGGGEEGGRGRSAKKRRGTQTHHIHHGRTPTNPINVGDGSGDERKAGKASNRDW
jgi:hypothetical protein